MHEAEKLSLEGIGRFVAASQEIRFESKSRPQVYGWVERVLIQQAGGPLITVSGAVPRSSRRYRDERVLGWNLGTDGTDSAFP